MYHIKNPQRGGITVFQCIIFTALLLFFGVMVDIVRIMLAEKEVQSAVNTAARSVLAGYNKELVGDYGLFALDTASEKSLIKDEFTKYLSANLQAGKSGFSFIKYKIDVSKTSVNGYRNLLSNDDNVFKEQILKYMKYRAPLNTTRNIIDKFAASGIFKKKEFAVKEKQVRERSQEIKLNLNKLNTEIKSANSTVKDISDYTINSANGREYLSNLKNLVTGYTKAKGLIESSVQSLDAYNKATEASNSYAESANDDENLKGGAEIKTHKSEFDNANEGINSAKTDIEGSLQSIRENLTSMETLQYEIESLSSSISTIQSVNTELVKSIASCDEDDIASLKNLVESLNVNNKTISELQSQMDDKLEDINKIKDGLEVKSIEEIEFAEAENRLEEAPKGDIVEKNSSISDLQEKLDSLLGNKRIDESWLINQQEYYRTQQKDNDKYEELSEKTIPSTEEDLNIAEEQNKSIFAFMDKVEAVLQSSTKNLYVVEYIMDRFTYHASVTERDHYFQKGEVEYILWSGNSQNGNIASTMTAIGFLRFAINSIDYFATSKVPHPVFRLVYALGKGLLKSVDDCYNLYRGENIDICPTLNKAGFKLNYADHLRVFLLIQAAADEKRQLNNIRQLIQVNIKNPDMEHKLQRPDFSISNYNTVIEAKTSVTVNLWFLPLFQLDKLKPQFFDGGKYIVSKEIHLGY